jgi:hypothetical protein
VEIRWTETAREGEKYENNLRGGGGGPDFLLVFVIFVILTLKEFSFSHFVNFYPT